MDIRSTRTRTWDKIRDFDSTRNLDKLDGAMIGEEIIGENSLFDFSPPFGIVKKRSKNDF